jgi:phospholipid/cholesterol/gamma-HCH transport system ATP-binding protein
MKSAYRVADRIAMLYRGQMRFIGSPAEIQRVEDPVVRGFVEGRPDLAQEAA